MHIQERDVRSEHIYKLSILEARNTTLESGGLDVIMELQNFVRFLCSIPPLDPA